MLECVTAEGKVDKYQFHKTVSEGYWSRYLPTKLLCVSFLRNKCVLPSQPTLTFGNHQSVFHIYELELVFFRIPHMRDDMVFNFLYLPYLPSMMPLRSICVVTNGKIYFFG